MEISEVINSIVDVCHRNQAGGVYLFGSRAKGNAYDRSDIDIAVLGIKNYWKLKDELDEIPTLKTIDMIDFDNCANGILKKRIIEDGKRLY